MRAFEFISANDSLQLLRTIFNKAFAEIDAQAQRQKREALAAKNKQAKKRARRKPSASRVAKTAKSSRSEQMAYQNPVPAKHNTTQQTTNTVPIRPIPPLKPHL